MKKAFISKWALIFFALIGLPFLLSATAPDVNNNAGTWVDNFNDQLGTFNLQNVLIDVFGGTTQLASGQSSGSQTSVIISPTSFDTWGQVCLDATYSGTSDLTLDLLNGDNDTAITGFQGINMGSIDSNGCFDISGIDATANPTIKVRINHTSGSTIPSVKQLKVTWNPITYLLFDKIATEEVGAGQIYPYKIRLSVNFVEGLDVVVWDPLPILSSGTVSYQAGEDYGQDDSPSFYDASHGGMYTSTPITVRGQNIPANSVYWDFDQLEEGSSFIFKVFLEVPNGTLDSTLYTNQAFAHVSNGEDKVSEVVETYVRSEPAPSIVKAHPTLIQPGNSRIFALRDTNYVVPGSTIQFFIRDPYGATDGNDYDEEFRERMYNTVLWDNLDDLTPWLVGTPTDITGIKNGSSVVGQYTNTPVTIGSTTVPANSVYWDFGTFEPGATYEVSFKQQVVNTYDAALRTNYAYLGSDQSETIQDELPFTLVPPGPGGCYCKVGYFPTYPSDEQDLNCSSFDGLVPLPFGDPIRYEQVLINCSLGELEDLVFYDRVPDEVEFVSAGGVDRTGTDVTAIAGVRYFYYTVNDHLDYEVNPTFDYTNLTNPGAGWSETIPADLSTVEWVAWYVPQLSSDIEGTANPITNFKAVLNVNTQAPTDPCDWEKIVNMGLVDVHEYTDLNSVHQVFTSPLHYQDADTTRLAPAIGEFNIDPQRADLTAVAIIPGTANYTLEILNDSEFAGPTLEVFSNVVVTLQLSQINVNGSTAYPSILNVIGGTITNFDPSNGLVVLEIGQLGVKESKEVQLELSFPTGTEDDSEYTITASLSGEDNFCNPSTGVINVTGLVSGSPIIQVYKDPALNLIGSGDSLIYDLNFRNIGTSPSTQNWIVDRIPFRTSFVEAYATGGEQVWFTQNLPPDMPANQISVINPVGFSTIFQNFSPGIVNDNGTPTDPTDDIITSPFGEQTTWIAYMVDNPSGTPQSLEVDPTYRTVSFMVQNDDDEGGDSLDGSSSGTVIFNEEVIFSKQNLPAIGNEVRTTIEDFPGLELSKRSDKEIVLSNESFNWIIEYRNNSHATDDLVTITDNLPANVTINSISHEWNTVAGGGGITDITSDSNVSVTNNLDGTTSIEVLIAGAPGLKSDLLENEGGLLYINVTPTSGIPSGVVLMNEVEAIATNAISITRIVDEDPVTVLNPDLLISKIGGQAEAESGDEITYTILVSNRGLHDAINVVVEDILPTGMSYVAGSTQMLSPGFTIGEPSGTTTLSWANLIETASGTAGYLPATSADVYFSYRAVVTGAVGDEFPNIATVSTSYPEDDVYINTDTASVVIPPADLIVIKDGQDIAAPGEEITWKIDYSNAANHAAQDVYIIDQLPDPDADGNTEVTFLNTNTPNGVTPYYSGTTGTTPAFDPNNPTSGGWSLTPTTPVNHIAYLIGDMAALAPTQRITLTAILTEPITGINPPAGTSFDNIVNIYQLEADGDPSNNTDTFTTKTPGIDVSLKKAGSAEGTFPGLRPGDNLSYTFTIENKGTQPAYGLRVEDQLPSNFIPTGNFSEFTTVEVVDAFGSPIALIDPTGADMSIAVSPTMTGTPAAGASLVWYFGTTASTSSPDHYRNVGIPVGGSVIFTINGTVPDDAVDGGVVTNGAQVVYEGIPSNTLPEEVLFNNVDTVFVNIYRPDVVINKTVIDVPDNDEEWTEAGHELLYTLEYNNQGNAAADNVVISEIVPIGTTIVPGSLLLPSDASVEWLPNENEPTNFEITFANPLPAPANYDGEFGDPIGTVPSGTLDRTMDTGAAEPITGNTSVPVAPVVPNVTPPTPPVAPTSPIAPTAPVAPIVPNVVPPAAPALVGGITLGSCNCDTQIDIPPIECEALVALYNSTDGANWTGMTTAWGSNNSPSTWTGISLVGGRVSFLSLTLKNLTGTIPPELGNLTSATNFSLNQNQLTGTIPPELGNLSSISIIYLNSNQLSGSIPAELGNLSTISSLFVSSNQLTGSIPPELGNLSTISSLFMDNNQLTGSIPAELGNLSSIIALRSGTNQLSGSIPPELGNLTNISELRLESNQLTGAIPAELGNISSLRSLYLNANQLSGSIPAELGNLSNLTSLFINSNQLTGSIPAELGNLSDLISLFIDTNQLTGSIPAELGSLSSLVLFRANSNQLSGSIPAELGNLSSVVQLYFHSNQLTGAIPPELGNLTAVTQLYFNSNQLSGPIPPELGNLNSITSFYFNSNQLSGSIPPELGNLTTLQGLLLNDNDLVCHVPEELANLTSVSPVLFRVSGNKLVFSGSGTFPDISTSPILNSFFTGKTVSLIETQNSLDGSEDLSSCFEGYLETIHDIPVSCELSDNNGWLRLEETALAADGTAINYTFYPADTDGDGDCSNNGTALFGPVAAIDGLADISSITNLTTCPCVRVTMIPVTDNTVTPNLSSFKLAYDKGRPHYFGNTQLQDPTSTCDGISLTSGVTEPTTGNTSVPAAPAAPAAPTPPAAPIAPVAPAAPTPPATPAAPMPPAAPASPALVGGVTLGSCNCDTQTDIPPIACEALVALYNSTDGPNWINMATPFGSNNSPGTWTGVALSGGQIASLILQIKGLNGTLPPEIGNLGITNQLSIQVNPDLTGSLPPEVGNLTNMQILRGSLTGLSGTIPAELGNCSALTQLLLDRNDFSGDIPPELGNLTNILYLTLYTNNLTGTIPAELGNLTGMDRLWLYDNNLTGTIPPELGNLPALGQLYLHLNQLTGSIPPELGNINSLTGLDLNNNQLTGTIPTELGNLTNLALLSVYANQLTGSIPLELGSLTNLTKLYLFDNLLTGIIPEELGALTNLFDLRLNENQLSGSIPPSLGNLTGLVTFYLYTNQLSGSIPPELGNLSVVELFYLSDNQLTGSIPPELGNLAACKLFYLQTNQLSGSIPPELGNLTTVTSFFVQSNNLVCHIPEELANLTSISGGNSIRFSDNKLVFSGTGAWPNVSTSTVLNNYFATQAGGLNQSFITVQNALDGTEDISGCVTQTNSPGVYAVPIYTNNSVLAWDQFINTVSVPEGTNMTFSIFTEGIDDNAGCTGTVFVDHEYFTLENGFRDISDIDASNTELCMEVYFESDEDNTLSPCLDGWSATYKSTESPSITFKAMVDNPVIFGQTQVDNTATISTTTPELNDLVENNTASDSIFIRQTDVAIIKNVDKAAVVGADDETITYTLDWEVLGPQSAINTIVTDILPEHLAYDSAVPVPTTVDTDYLGSGRTALIWALGDLITNTTGSISITTHETDGVNGDNLLNTVSISNDRQETDYDNNDDDALTVVGDFANVYIQKDGPSVLDLNDAGQYILTYGNNGNLDAANTTITDQLPTGLSFTSATDSNGGTVTSVAPNGFSVDIGNLAIDATGTVTIDFSVGSDVDLVGTALLNNAQITTTTVETNLSDNQDNHEIAIELLQLASISGTVWHDDNRDGVLEAGEQGIENVLIQLTGTDIFGNTVFLTEYTDENGEYTFPGINPGTYNLEEVQPEGWLTITTTGSDSVTDIGDVLETSSNPQTARLDDGSVGGGATSSINEAYNDIVLDGGDRGIEYNFGEDLGLLGDTVWIDLNIDGIQDPNEPPVEGVTVRLYQDKDMNGLFDPALDSLVEVTSTNLLGAYLFENLYEDDYFIDFDLSTLPDSINQVTIQNAGTDDVNDSDADPTTGLTELISLPAGGEDLTWDMGVYGDLLIGNYVWIDTNMDGIQDMGETPVEGINVTLYNSVGTELVTVQTNADGLYYFNSDTLSNAGLMGVDGVLAADTEYYIVVGTNGQFDVGSGALFYNGNNYQITVDSTGTMESDSDAELANNLGFGFDGLPYTLVTTPYFGQADTTFDFGFANAQFDYGDLFDTGIGTSTNNYETLAASNGPSHLIVSGLMLGATVDQEADGQPDTEAAGDDDMDGNDDEDGVLLPAVFLPESSGDIVITATNTTGSTAYIRAWIDWNNDGDFDDPGELVIDDNDGSGSFMGTYPVITPATAVLGESIGVRVRISNQDGLEATGPSSSGEVEDYLAMLGSIDYPDYESSCIDFPCHFVSEDIYLGSGVTSETTTTQNDMADGDEDDGLTLNSSFSIRAGVTVQLPLTVFNNTGQTAYVAAWADWNGDGDFEDANEQFANESYDAATYNGSFMVNLPANVPTNVFLDGSIAFRFRISTDDSITLSPCGGTGCAINGEVEDYLIQVECATQCLPTTIKINKGNE